MTAPADDVGISALAAGARAAMARSGGDGEGVGLVVRQLGTDARGRLRGGEEDSTLTLAIDVRGTELVVTLTDKGEPVTAPPDAVLPLLESGVATAAEARTDGIGNLTEVRFPLPTHHRMIDADSLEVVPDDAAPSAEPVTIRAMVPGDAAALTRAIYRCYGWSYPSAGMYYPERIAAALASGERIGEVAVTESGEIASHWGAIYLSPTVVETGGTVTDPRFRRRGLAKTLGDRLLERLIELEVVARIREPVMTHPATQEIALHEGATMVGAYLKLTHPMQQIGITDDSQSSRVSLLVAYSALRPLEPATLWIPSQYTAMAQIALEASDWPRVLAPASRAQPCPESTTISTAFDSGNRVGMVDVGIVGADLVDAVDTALHQMRRSGAEYVGVRLPANQPALATMAAGLVELGLGYAALIPAFRSATELNPGGDVLVTQWLIEPEIDTTGWVFADDSVESLVRTIVAQTEDVGNRGVFRQRRAARRAQLFAALGT